MVGLWVAAVGWAAEPVSSEPLEDPAFRFCHVPGANAADAHAWCALLDADARARCPGLAKTCDENVVTEDPRGCEPPGSADGSADKLGGEPDKPPEPSACQPNQTPDASGLLRWVAAFLVAALVLVIARLAWATFGRLPQAPRPVSVAQPELAPEPIPEGPPTDLLDAARAALRAGRTGEAVMLARGAALRRLGEAGKIVLHRSRTDREYQRRLGAEPELQSELRRIVRSAEEVRFGGRPVDESTAAGAVTAAERILAGLVAAGLVLVLLAAAPARAQDYASYGPDGDAALLPLLRQYGYDPGWRLRSLSDLGEDTDVLVLDLSSVAPTDEQWPKVKAWVEAGGVLVVGGDASAAWPELGSIETGSGFTSEVAPAFAAGGLPAPISPLATWFWKDGTGRPLVSVTDGTEVGQAVELLDVGVGVVVAIADPMLLENAAFVRKENQAFIGELVYLGQSLEGWPVAVPAKIQLATSAASASSGSGGGASPLASLAQAGLLLFVLQVLATWSIAALNRGWPLGAPRDPVREDRERFSEHLVALGTRYFLRKDTGWALHRLAGLWAARLGRSGLELAAQRAGYTPADARRWAEGVEAAAAAPAPSRSDDLERMEELWRITRREPDPPA
jgi:hypothetical protein